MARAAQAETVLQPPLDLGTFVRVHSCFPSLGHIRTPYYLRGKRGEIVRYFGLFYDPTALATGTANLPICHLYQVLFDYMEIWEGRPLPHTGTKILADIYDNWLAPLHQD